MDGRSVFSSTSSDGFSPAWQVPVDKDPVLDIQTQILPITYKSQNGQEEKEQKVDVTFYKLVPKKEKVGATNVRLTRGEIQDMVKPEQQQRPTRVPKPREINKKLDIPEEFKAAKHLFR